MRPIRVKKRIGQRRPPFRRPVAEEKPRVVEIVGVAGRAKRGQNRGDAVGVEEIGQPARREGEPREQMSVEMVRHKIFAPAMDGDQRGDDGQDNRRNIE